MEISIEPWKKLIIHEVIEYKFDDWVKQIAFSTRSSGGGIPTMQWTNGIVFSPANFPTTNITVEVSIANSGRAAIVGLWHEGSKVKPESKEWKVTS